MMSFIRWGWRERDFGFEEERKQIIITGKFGKRIPDLGSRSLWMTAQTLNSTQTFEKLTSRAPRYFESDYLLRLKWEFIAIKII